MRAGGKAGQGRPSGARSRTFRSLRSGNYRRYAAATLLSNLGTWMQRTAQAWLVLHLPGGDGTDLGLVLGLQFVPILLFGSWAGVLIDRWDKRSLLRVTQAGAGMSALLLGVLDTAGVVQIWHVYLTALILGAVTTVDTPARQSFVIEIVGGADLPNAVALNSASMNLARLLGPAVAGFGIEWFGTAVMFWVNGASYGAVIVALWRMDRSALMPAARVRRAPGQVGEGLRYVRGNFEILLVICMMAVIAGFGLNFQVTIPLMATEVFGRGAGEFGLLTSTAALGSLIGALASARRERPRLRLVVLGALAFGLFETLAGLMPGLLTFGLVLLVVGICQQTFTTSANALVQLAAGDSIRGRVMAIYFTASRGGRAIGAPAVGAMAQLLGARWGLITGGMLSLTCCGLAGLWLLRRRSRQRAGTAERTNT